MASTIHRAARRHLPPDRPLARVTVALGEFHAVEPALLHYAWRVLLSDSMDAKADLSIRLCNMKYFCPSCGVDGKRGVHCPCCGSLLQVRGGDEFDLVAIAYDDG